ncbi:unnamed protein product, partial [Musa hybrid cultivar]
DRGDAIDLFVDLCLLGVLSHLPVRHHPRLRICLLSRRCRCSVRHLSDLFRQIRSDPSEITEDRGRWCASYRSAWTSRNQARLR